VKTTLCLIAIVSFVASACAGSIDLYLTRGSNYQFISAADRFNPNEKTFAFVSGAPNPATLSHGPFTQAAGTAETYYVWADFSNFPDNGNGALQSSGFGLMGSYATGNATAAGYWYRHRQGTTYRRFDPASGQFPFPGGAAAIQAQGIFAPSSADLQMSSGGVSHALLAAFQFTTNNINGKFNLGVDQTYFLAVREYDADANLIKDWDTNGTNWYPNLTVMGRPYTHPNSQTVLAISTIVPEPASLALLALITLTARRR
jgi:hypothetical protein